MKAPSLAAFAYHMQPTAKRRANAQINVVTRQLSSTPAQTSRERSPHGSRNVHSPRKHLPNVAVREGKLLGRRPLHITRAEARHVYPHPQAIDLPIWKTSRRRADAMLCHTERLAEALQVQGELEILHKRHIGKHPCLKE